MRIAVIGTGALGLYYGTRLAQAGNEVSFVFRRDYEHVRRHGIRIREAESEVALPDVRAFRDTAEIGEVDLVVVALKATANALLEHQLAPLLHASTAVLTLQNGLGADEQIAGWVGEQRVLGALCFIAATRTAPGEVTCYHRGTITLGELGRPASERTRSIAALFETAGVKTRAVDDLVAARWKKLVWNIPFNGLCIAAGGVTTDVVCGDSLLAAEVRALMAEVVQAAAGQGIAIPEEFVRQQFDVTPPMGAYRPSSLVDYLAGQEVEIETIWGEPLRRAQASGVPVPRLALLYALLQRQVKQKRQSS